MPELVATYPYSSAGYDELLNAQGGMRSHWKSFMESLDASRPEQIHRRVSQVQRQIHENGVTYNVYANSQGSTRPWDLDLLPLILDSEEWQGIRVGMIQRARLLNQILADFYGPQDLLRSGEIPPALVQGQSGFLRSAHGIPMPDNVYLHLYAADLARSPDGRWWVIADRTQAPSGAGYALENRLVISRIFPDLFRQLRVEHLAGFFHSLQQSLTHWAPHEQMGELPRIVVLTPGPYNETYFEHAYLARYLGFLLVEGHDLTVRDGRVWLKALEGLQRVHAIVRRLDDDYCDPLEFRGDSALGIPGLAQAARLGNVLVANALGSSLLESSAFFGFLPGLCKRLLGESLLIPSVATWWCGEEAALEDALPRLDHLVIKGAFPQLRLNACFGADLSAREKERLIRRIRQRPYNYVAQETVQLSQAPTLDLSTSTSLQLRPRSMGLRVHVAATPDGFVVMPGGLTRIAGGTDARVIALQRGGASKDTWVLSRTPVSTFSLLPTSFKARDLVHSGANLTSRVAENLFWFGRYTERCDNSARLLRLTLSQFVENSGMLREQGGPPPFLLALCREFSLLPSKLRSLTESRPSSAGGDERLELRADLLESLVNPAADESFAAHLGYLRQVGFSLKERLSLDNWRTLNNLSQTLEQQRDLLQQEPHLGEALAFLDQSIVALMTMAGFAMDGMTRDMGWHFLSIGRRMERLQFLVAMVRQGLATRLPTRAHPSSPDPRFRSDWKSLNEMLELADSSVTYRSRYMMHPQTLPVLDLLVRDRTNPRSISFQLQVLSEDSNHLDQRFGTAFAAELQSARQKLEQLDWQNELEGTEPAALAALLEELGRIALTLSDRLCLRFFSQVTEHRTGS